MRLVWLFVCISLSMMPSAEATPLSWVVDASGVRQFDLNSIVDSQVRDDLWGLSRLDTVADLSTGELKITAETLSCLSGPNCANAGINGFTGFGDRVTITSPFVGDLSVQLLLSVEGVITNPIYPQLAQTAGLEFSVRLADGSSVNESRAYLIPGPVSETLVLSFSLPSTDPFFSFGALFAVSSGTIDGIVDFGNTLSLGLVLPAGTTWVSDSGVLLSNPPGSVPEPSTLAFLICGLGFALLRRNL